MTATLTQQYMKTAEVCREVQQPYYVIVNMIRGGRIARPEKDASGDLIWSAADIEAVRRVLASRSAARRTSGQAVATV